MGKPSIFSKEYQKHKKRRQKKIAFLVLFLIVTIIFFTYVSPVSQLIKGSALYKELQAKYKDNGSSLQQEENDPNEGSQGAVEEEQGPDEEENTSEEKYFEISLAEDKGGKAHYKESDGKIIFLSYSGGEGFQYEVSPSKEKMLIYDSNNQDIYEIEAEDSIKNLTYEYYTTTKGSKIYKVNTLSNNPEYLWHGSPRYLSEDKIVYKSNLPWLNSANEYIWLIDTTTMSYSHINSSKAKTIDFGSLSEEGLQVTIDGVNRVLAQDGRLR